MRSQRGSTRRLASLAAVFVVLGACGPTGHRFITKLSYPDGSYPLQVTLFDQTGIVAAVEPLAGGEGTGDPEPHVAPAHDKSGFSVTWLGGACTDGAQLTFGRTESGYELRLQGSRPLIASCPAIGLYRGVFVRLVEGAIPPPIAASGSE